MARVSQQTIKVLYALSGNTCYFHGCETTLTDPAWHQTLGQVVYICGGPGSPRYDPNQSEHERNGFSNLMLMCPVHHTLIDRLQPENFPVYVLQDMKEQHERRSQARWATETDLEKFAIESIGGQFEIPGLLGPDGQPLDTRGAQGESVIENIKGVGARIYEHCRLHPDALMRLDPREFEEFTSEAWARGGWEVQLTPISKDGGIDIYAARKDGFASVLYLVQCKRYSPTDPVGVEVVRELRGVVDLNRATGGSIVTTSRFTSGALEIQQTIPWTMTLHDLNAVEAWLDESSLP